METHSDFSSVIPSSELNTLLSCNSKEYKIKLSDDLNYALLYTHQKGR